MRAHQHGDFRIQDSPLEGDLPHVFGRVILSSDRSPHPVPLAPETLSVADSAPGTLVALQWSSVEHADTYRLEIVPVAGSGRAESFINDGGFVGQFMNRLISHPVGMVERVVPFATYPGYPWAYASGVWKHSIRAAHSSARRAIGPTSSGDNPLDLPKSCPHIGLTSGFIRLNATKA